MSKIKILLFISIIPIMLINSCCPGKEYNLYAALHGIIYDPTTDDPITNASVVLSPGGKTQTTGTDGHYEFIDLDPQQYTITVQKTGYQTNRKTVTAVISESTEANISLTQN